MRFSSSEKNLIFVLDNSQEAVDNDDGSGFFHTYSNVLVYGHYGQKADMAGHDNYHVGNLCERSHSACMSGVCRCRRAVAAVRSVRSYVCSTVLCIPLIRLLQMRTSSRCATPTLAAGRASADTGIRFWLCPFTLVDLVITIEKAEWV